MRGQPLILFNTPDIEVWPAHLLRARSNADARTLAFSTHVLRRKRDGRFLAAASTRGLEPLISHWARDVDADAAMTALQQPTHRGIDINAAGELPVDRLLERLATLGLDQTYGEGVGLDLAAEPAALAFAGFDRYRRPLWLGASASRAWQAMRHTAAGDAITLNAISGYRSHDYQLGIFERKMARGQSVQQILTVNAAPGYSEHHGGNALDIGTPGEPPAEESFEHTAAFNWLQRHAADFGFHMSYPRDNPHGIVYEPWHWCFR